jgi:hypothetical protein
VTGVETERSSGGEQARITGGDLIGRVGQPLGKALQPGSGRGALTAELRGIKLSQQAPDVQGIPAGMAVLPLGALRPERNAHRLGESGDLCDRKGAGRERNAAGRVETEAVPPVRRGSRAAGHNHRTRSCSSRLARVSSAWRDAASAQCRSSTTTTAGRKGVPRANGHQLVYDGEPDASRQLIRSGPQDADLGRQTIAST